MNVKLRGSRSTGEDLNPPKQAWPTADDADHDPKCTGDTGAGRQSACHFRPPACRMAQREANSLSAAAPPARIRPQSWRRRTTTAATLRRDDPVELV